MLVPEKPKIYHIVHVDRLSSISSDGYLLSHAEVIKRPLQGPTISMNHIKQRRLKLLLNSHPDLYVGNCVPFYFCPRSVMLYLIHQGNHGELAYRAGQGPIVHLEADLYTSIAWADQHNKRWAYTLSNAGARYFEDRCDISHLNELDWDAIYASHWAGENIPIKLKENKQAEFLVEERFSWHLIERIGVYSQNVLETALHLLPKIGHQPVAEILPRWYY